MATKTDLDFSWSHRSNAGGKSGNQAGILAEKADKTTDKETLWAAIRRRLDRLYCAYEQLSNRGTDQSGEKCPIFDYDQGRCGDRNLKESEFAKDIFCAVRNNIGQTGWPKPWGGEERCT